MVYFDQILHTKTCQHYLTTGTCNSFFAEHQFSRLLPVSENAHNSWTAWYIWSKFCILTYFNIVQSLVCKIVTSLCQELFWLLVKMLIILEPQHIFWSNFAYLYTPASNLGYLATPRTIFHGCQIVHWDPLNAKRSYPQTKLGMGYVKMHGFHGKP